MSDLLIRNLDPSLKAALAARAKANGRSLSKEAGQILERALAPRGPERGESVYAAIRRVVEPYGGFDLELPPRDDLERDPPNFD